MRRRTGGINEGVLNASFVVLVVLFVGLITHKISSVPPKPDLNSGTGNGSLLNQRVVAEYSRFDMHLAQLTVLRLIGQGVPADVAEGADSVILLVADKDAEKARLLIADWRDRYPSMKPLRILDAQSDGVSK